MEIAGGENVDENQKVKKPGQGANGISQVVPAAAR